MKAILPHVDDFRSIHNLDTLTGLTKALSHPGPRQAEGVTQWLQTVQ